MRERFDERVPGLGRVRVVIREHRWLRRSLAAIAALGAVALLGFAVLWWTVELPEEPAKPQSSVVLAANGEELAAFAPEGLRFEVGLGDVSPVAVKAVLSSEDRRFYSHEGFDPLGLARALWRNARGGRQGGSTITQQLVKVDYLNRERTLVRKVKEAVLAVKLERSDDKDGILERYLNTVYFGRNAYGIEAAARAYFGVHASELQVPQAALLAGLIRAPEAAEPTEDLDEARRRRRLVLDAMVRDEVITEAEARAAAASELVTVPPDRRAVESKLAPHFVDFARAEAERALGGRALTTAGLRIVTTIDPEAQRAAEAAIAEALNLPDDPQAALVALDTDGAVRAYVGGRDYQALKVDLVRGKAGGGSGRQPGSTFKPLVLAAALGKGITLGQRFPAPAHIDLTVDGQPWAVDNYGNESYGNIDVGEATAKSVNTVYARLLERVGPKTVADTARWMGIEEDLNPVPAIALGSAEISPYSLATAYASLAADGNRVHPYIIDRIEDNQGNTIWKPERPEADRAIPAEISRTVTRALEGVIDHGTGTAARLGRPAAGKTGTTQNNVDAWFAGYVPGYTAVVWLGNPDGAVPMPARGGRAVTGGGIPARIWRSFMSKAIANRPRDGFPAPPENLLAAPPPPSLQAEPAAAEPGQTIRVSGDGYQDCISWWVQLDGTLLASDIQGAAPDGRREASLQLPDFTPPGSYTISALCDDGSGAQPVASTPVNVKPDPQDTPSTTTTAVEERPTTTSSTTSTTTPTTQPPATTTTTTAATTTTTSNGSSGRDG